MILLPRFDNITPVLHKTVTFVLYNININGILCPEYQDNYEFSVYKRSNL